MEPQTRLANAMRAHEIALEAATASDDRVKALNASDGPAAPATIVAYAVMSRAYAALSRSVLDQVDAQDDVITGLGTAVSSATALAYGQSSGSLRTALDALIREREIAAAYWDRQATNPESATVPDGPRLLAAATAASVAQGAWNKRRATCYRDAASRWTPAAPPGRIAVPMQSSRHTTEDWRVGLTLVLVVVAAAIFISFVIAITLGWVPGPSLQNWVAVLLAALILPAWFLWPRRKAPPQAPSPRASRKGGWSPWAGIGIGLRGPFVGVGLRRRHLQGPARRGWAG